MILDMPALDVTTGSLHIHAVGGQPCHTIVVWVTQGVLLQYDALAAGRVGRQAARQTERSMLTAALQGLEAEEAADAAALAAAAEVLHHAQGVKA